MNTYRNHFSRSYENRSIKTSIAIPRHHYTERLVQDMSLKCNDREGQERHFQAGSRAWWPQTHNSCSQATRKSLFFHTNHMLGPLNLFSVLEHWAPLITIVMKDSHKYPHKQLVYEQQL